MPKFWQIAHARAVQTQGVWALEDTFTCQGKAKEDHELLMDEVQTQAETTETATNALDTTQVALEAEYAFFATMNTAIYQRLDSEIPDTDSLQKDVDQLGSIKQTGRATIDERTLKTVAAWTKVNTQLAALTPPQGPVVVRGITQAAYAARWAGVQAKKLLHEEKWGAWRLENSKLTRVAKQLDKLNKAWWQAWHSEFPYGTPEGDALNGVDTEQGQNLPQVLEIAAVVQEVMNLRVTYVDGTGQYATVRRLLYKVEGVHAEYQEEPVNLTGNVIGPFTAGQIVRVRTDVGNSRDNSELSEETVVTVA